MTGPFAQKKRFTKEGHVTPCDVHSNHRHHDDTEFGEDEHL